MRIITGTARGMNLAAPEGESTRPTSDRAKGAIFSAIQFDIEGRVVLDLFAGSGQLGLEALSRGAQKAVFCDADPAAAEIVKQNCKKTRCFKESNVICCDYREYIRGAAVAGDRFSLVFIDPPYAKRLHCDALRKIYEAGILTPDAIVICETDTDAVFAEDTALEEYYTLVRRYKAGKAYMFLLEPKNKEEDLA